MSLESSFNYEFSQIALLASSLEGGVEDMEFPVVSKKWLVEFPGIN